jgi:beta-phosphoglucomutase-like phosphatase (HAD superfamily)
VQVFSGLQRLMIKLAQHGKCSFKDMIMNHKAILFGSIGTIVETSELQRRSFNQAFAEAGLDWNWSPDEYQMLLAKSGGCDRIENYAVQRGVDVDVKQLHRQKTKIFDSLMDKETTLLRPGVASLISYALDKSLLLAFVTNTSKVNIDAVFYALGDQIKRNDFSFIGNDKMVSNPKPSPDIYLKALSELHLDAQDCIAIEDTEVSMQSALAASIRCIGFPGVNTQGNDFSGAVLVTNHLSADDLAGL